MDNWLEENGRDGVIFRWMKEIIWKSSTKEKICQLFSIFCLALIMSQHLRPSIFQKTIGITQKIKMTFMQYCLQLALLTLKNSWNFRTLKEIHCYSEWVDLTALRFGRWRNLFWFSFVFVFVFVFTRCCSSRPKCLRLVATCSTHPCANMPCFRNYTANNVAGNYSNQFTALKIWNYNQPNSENSCKM